MTDDYSDEEFAPIAAAMKRLPYFEPSSHFADRVIARVNIAQPARVAVARESYPVRHRAAPLPHASAPHIGRTAPYFPRSLPARIAAVALLASLSVTMSAVALMAMFQMDLFVFVAQVFGEGTIAFLASLAADVGSAAAGTVAGSAATAGTASGLAVIGSFAAGAIAATAGLRAAASINRKAA